MTGMIWGDLQRLERAIADLSYALPHDWVERTEVQRVREAYWALRGAIETALAAPPEDVKQ